MCIDWQTKVFTDRLVKNVLLGAVLTVDAKLHMFKECPNCSRQLGWWLGCKEQACKHEDMRM